MKLIKAYVRKFLVDEVISALKEIGAPRLTAIDVRALGDEKDIERQFGREFLEYKKRVPAFIPRFGKGMPR